MSAVRDPQPHHPFSLSEKVSNSPSKVLSTQSASISVLGKTFLPYMKVIRSWLISFPKDNHCQYLNVYSDFPGFLYVGLCVYVNTSGIILYKWFSTWFYLMICLEHLSVSVRESLLHDFNVCRECCCSRIYLATLLLMYIYEFPNPLLFCYYQPGYNNYCCIYIFCTQASISLGWVSGSKIAGVKGMRI